MPAYCVCPGCGALFNVPEDLVGKQVRCKSCRTVFVAVSNAEGQRLRPPAPSPVRSRPANPVIFSATPDAVAPATREAGTSEESAQTETAEQPAGPADQVPPVVEPVHPMQQKTERPVSRPRPVPRRPRPPSPAASAGTPALAWVMGCLVAGGILLVVVVAAIFVGYFIYEVQRENRNQQVKVEPPPKGPGLPGGPFGRPGGDPDILSVPLWKWDAQDVAQAELIMSTGQKPELLTYESPLGGDANNALLRVAVENPVPRLTEKEQQETVMAADGSLPRDVLERVERATVRLRVLRTGSPAHPPFQGEGSGFFALAPGIVVTNAHVVGMKQPGSPPPSSVTVFVNSGEADEKQFNAKVLHADGYYDLALLRVEGSAEHLPEPLKVVSASTLFRTQLLVAFGFPYGENLNTRMSTSKVSVASFVRDGKETYRIQMNGELNPGNSGGPVVDAQGRVVGVAVSIYVNLLRNTGISFAVPAEQVWYLYHGRFGDLIVGLPRQSQEDAGGIVLPVSLEVLDPLKRFKEVGIAWSIADPETRLPAEAVDEPPAEGRVALPPGKQSWRRGQLNLPALPEGKVYHLRPYAVEPEGKCLLGTSTAYQPMLALQSLRTQLRSPPEGDNRPRQLSARYRVVSRSGENGNVMPLAVSLGCRGQLDADGKIGHFLGFDLGVRIGDRPLPRSLFQEILSHQLGNPDLQMHANEPRFAKAGQFTKELAGLHRVLDQFLAVLQAPPEGQDLQPGRSWVRAVTVHGDPLGVQEPIPFQIGYTYVGMAEQAGKKLPCILFTGDAVPGTGKFQGTVHGLVWIDPDSRRVVEGRAFLDAVMQIADPTNQQSDIVQTSAVWKVELADGK